MPEVLRDSIKPLEGWLTLQQVADLFGYSKQGIGKKVFHSADPMFDLDRDVRRIGDDRFFFLVRESAVEDALAYRRTAMENVTRGASGA